MLTPPGSAHIRGCSPWGQEGWPKPPSKGVSPVPPGSSTRFAARAGGSRAGPRFITKGA